MNGILGAIMGNVQKPVAEVPGLDFEQYQKRQKMEVIVLAKRQRKKNVKPKPVQVSICS